MAEEVNTMIVDIGLIGRLCEGDKLSIRHGTLHIDKPHRFRSLWRFYNGDNCLRSVKYVHKTIKTYLSMRGKTPIALPPHYIDNAIRGLNNLKKTYAEGNNHRELSELDQIIYELVSTPQVMTPATGRRLNGRIRAGTNCSDERGIAIPVTHEERLTFTVAEQAKSI